MTDTDAPMKEVYTYQSPKTKSMITSTQIKNMMIASTKYQMIKMIPKTHTQKMDTTAHDHSSDSNQSTMKKLQKHKK